MRRALLFLVLTACSDTKMPPPLQGSGRSPGGSFGGVVNGADSGSTTSTALAIDQPSPRGLAVDGSYVYFTCLGQGGKTGSVRRVPKGGGPVEEIATGLDAPYAVTLARGEVIFSEHEPGRIVGNLRAVAPGGNVRTIAEGIETPTALANDGTWIYYPSAAGGAGIALWRTQIAGSPTQEVAQTLGAFVPGGVALYDDWVYFAGAGAGATIYRARAVGGGAEALDQEPSAQLADLVIADDRVWLADLLPRVGRVISLPAAGGPTRVDVIDIDNPAHLATDGRWVYFTSHVADGAVGAVNIADGSVVALATGLAFPWAIAVDDGVYVGTADSIVRLSKL